MRLSFWLSAVVDEAKVGMKQLRPLLLGRVVHHPQAGDRKSSSVGTPAREAGEASAWDEEVGQGGAAGSKPASSEAVGETIKPRGGHRPGTGRLGADTDEGATRLECRHDEVAVGQRCPVCGQGTLDALPAGVEGRIDGNALLSARRSEVENLRGAACGAILTAGLPEDVGDEKYSARARAVLAVSRSLLGVPSSRLQG
jgi:hypothetical protein